jgi:hypothetical protein
MLHAVSRHVQQGNGESPKLNFGELSLNLTSCLEKPRTLNCAWQHFSPARLSFAAVDNDVTVAERH